MWVRTIDCVGLAVRVTADRAAATAVEPLLAPYAESAAPAALRYELSAAPPRLVRDGGPSMIFQSLPALMAELELDLYRQIARLVRGPLIHAAALGREGRALVFAGRSGAGKSTLVRALMVRDLGVLSEECVLLERDGLARGLTRGLQLRRAAPAPPGCAETHYRTLDADGRLLRTRLLLPPENRLVRSAARAAALVILEHSADASVGRVALSAGEALASLWPLTLNASREVLDGLADVVSRVAVWRFSTRAPEQALELACGLARECGLTLGAAPGTGPS